MSSQTIVCPKCKKREASLSHGGDRVKCGACGKYSVNPETVPGKMLALEREVRRLSDENRRLTREDNELAIIRRMVGKINARMTDDVPAWAAKAAPRGAQVHGIPTLMLSDLHFGEVVFPNQINHVNEYSTTIAKQRLKRVVEGAVKMLRHTLSPGHFGGITLILGGDMIEGTIHDELRETVDETVMEAILTLHDELVFYIKGLADEFGHVHVPCVAGNHGRIDRKPRMKNGAKLNYDWLLYQFIAKSIGADPKYRDRVTFQIPEGFECVYRLHNVTYMLTHGDSFKGGDGITGPLMPWMRGSLKASKSYAAMGIPFDVMVMGHWHQLRYLGSVIVNGSLVGYNEYAQKNHFGFEVPQQALWLTHPERGLTFQEAVFADEARPHVANDSWLSIHTGG